MWGFRVVEVSLRRPLQAVGSHGVVALGGPKQRAVLALASGRVVTTDVLVDSVWGEQADVRAVATLQVYVPTLRKALDQTEPGAAAWLRLEGDVYLSRGSTPGTQALDERQGVSNCVALAPLMRVIADTPSVAPSRSCG